MHSTTPKCVDRDYDLERKIRSFVESKTVIPKFPPLPDISDILAKDSKNHPLMKFKLDALKKHQVDSYLKERALTAKVDEFVKRVRKGGWEKKELKSKYLGLPIIREGMKEYAKQAVVQTIHSSWINGIKSKIPGKMYIRYKDLCEKLLDEVKKEYSSTLTELGLYSMFSIEDKRQLFAPYEEDVGGKTEFYPRFCERRNRIAKLLFITHPLVRNIQNNSYTAIPEYLIDFRIYRREGHYNEVENLITIILGDLKKAEDAITKTWYLKLMLMLPRRAVEEIPKALRQNIINCCSNLISIQITECINRTVKHFLKVLQDPLLFPLLSLTMEVENEIKLVPTIEDSCASFGEVIHRIMRTGQDLPAMETYFGIPALNKTLKVTRSNTLTYGSIHDLKEVLHLMFRPVFEHITHLNEEFHGLFSEEQYKDVDLTRESMDLDRLIDKLAELKAYEDKARDLTAHLYFDVGKVSQRELSENLIEISKMFKEGLASAATTLHMQKCETICAKFEEVVRYALMIPKTTEELLAQGKYMLYANTAFMAEMKRQILEMVAYKVKLANLIEMTLEHMLLVRKTVNWIFNIKPIFEQNSSNFEATKFELEDKVRNTTEKLKADIDKFAGTLVFLNNIDDTKKIFEYVQYMQKDLRIIEGFLMTIEWINKEEQLFNFQISTYPLLEEIKAIVFPFARLIFTAYKWYNRCKVFMDGAFDELNPEDVETFVDDNYKELVKTQKMYKAKCKMQSSEDYPRRYRGIVDDPDPENWPAPLKICAQVIQDIRDFRQHLQTVGIMCNSALCDRHWNEMSTLAGFDLTPNAGSTLRKVIDYKLDHLLDQFEIISVGATKELQLQMNLAKMKAEWVGVVFSTSPYKETDLEILTGLDEIQALLDDHLIKALSMRGSAFVKPVEEEVKEWYALLDRVNKTIDEWGKVQVSWMYFRPIFSAKDIIAQMPEEGVMFKVLL